MDFAIKVHLLFRPVFPEFSLDYLIFAFLFSQNFPFSLLATELIDRVTAEENKEGINNKKCLFL